MQSYELDLVKNELKDVRESNKSLDSTKFSQEKSITEYSLRIQGLQRELEDKQQLFDKQQSLLDQVRSQLSAVEQAWADERAKTQKMEDKLLHSKAEIEMAAKILEKMREEKKQLKQRIKVKNAVVMQQEQQIQAR